MSALMTFKGERTDPHRRRKPRVLIVEDDPNSRWVLGALLRRLGYECEVAIDGREALAKVDRFGPQVILMDLMLPGLDGLEATRRLKADARTRGIPVLALSGRVAPDGESLARQAGCDDFVPKPVSLNDLLDRIDRHARPA